jgi:hypothetical protein
MHSSGSFPKGRGVNAGIRKGCYKSHALSLSLPLVTDLSASLIQKGKGAYLWNVDLTCPYRQLWTCPLSTPLLEFRHDNDYSVDIYRPLLWLPHLCLSMCSRHCCSGVAFTATGSTGLLLPRRFCQGGVLRGAGVAFFSVLLSLLEELGMKTSPGKCIPP